MFSQVYDYSEAPLQIYTDSQVAMGDLAYNYLHHAQGDYFSDWLGLPLFSDDTSWSTNSFSPNPISEQLTTEFTMPSPSGFPSYFPLTPSPPPSELPTPECQQPALPPHEPGCHQATPFFESARKKWGCDVCGKYFRGRYECNRHIQSAGKRARCLACNKEIKDREDSLRRHYSRFCKKMDRGRDSENVRFEDAFAHL